MVSPPHPPYPLNGKNPLSSFWQAPLVTAIDYDRTWVWKKKLNLKFRYKKHFKTRRAKYIITYMAQAWWILSKKQGSGKSFRQIPEGISWLIMSMVTFVYLREGCRGGELERISLTHFSSCYHDSECAVTINLLSWTTFSHSPTPHWNNFLPSTHQQSLFHSSSWHFMSIGSWIFPFYLHANIHCQVMEFFECVLFLKRMILLFYYEYILCSQTLKLKRETFQWDF